MSLTQDKYQTTPSGKRKLEEISKDPEEISVSAEGLEVNTQNPFARQDYATIIKFFEIEASNWTEEDYALAYHYKDVYSTKDFASRTKEQMSYYPGIHRDGNPPTQDPLYTNAKEQSKNRQNFWDNALSSPQAFEGGLRSRAHQDIDYSKVFGSDTSAKTKAENIGNILTKCVPCFDRLLDLDGLLPDADLLEVHLMNIKIRTDLIDKLKGLFDDPGIYIDICELLRLLNKMCPQDLMAMLSLLTQYLAKINLDIQFNIDFIISLVGPILSPFLDALAEWLDKWIALIVDPMICVIDHINETILTVQSAKIPFSNITSNIDFDLNLAGPLHQNASVGGSASQDLGFGNSSGNLFTSGTANPHSSGWLSSEAYRFETPLGEKYNPSTPTFPSEETRLAQQEMSEAWSPSMSQEEREETDKKWKELRKAEQEKRRVVPKPLTKERRDGTRWSKDDVPNSEKFSGELAYSSSYHPPEKQNPIQNSDYYIDISPLLNSITQMRNIVQGAVQYVKDWFTYVVQMVYDLLGVDFSWMAKKTGTTFIKSRIIQLIFLIKSILKAISENGLECGATSSLDPEQQKFIIEDTLNKFSVNDFVVQDNGDIEIVTPGSRAKPAVVDNSKSEETIVQKKKLTRKTETGVGNIAPNASITDNEQKSAKSGIIVKNCLNTVNQQDLNKVRQWIAEFEARANS